ncbi:hypothetical protein [Nocardia sp. NPDC020380]|uniref:hypothetical protein n=1 Tax=Nocardia sp. NPDC020380 TaxID=3364309 RepID=UPI003788C46C
MPSTALSTALVGLSDTRGDELVSVIENNASLGIPELENLDEARDLADVWAVATEPIDVTAAHTISVARHLDRPIITTVRAGWVEPEKLLPFRLHVVEFADGE